MNNPKTHNYDAIRRSSVLDVLRKHWGEMLNPVNLALQKDMNDIPCLDSNAGWYPVKRRPLTEEELEEYGHEYSEMWDCTLPDESCTVIITYTYRDQKYVTYTEFDFDDKYFDDYNDEVIAWMPLPEPYKE